MNFNIFHIKSEELYVKPKSFLQKAMITKQIDQNMKLDEILIFCHITFYIVLYNGLFPIISKLRP